MRWPRAPTRATKASSPTSAKRSPGAKSSPLRTCGSPPRPSPAKAWTTCSPTSSSEAATSSPTSSPARPRPWVARPTSTPPPRWSSERLGVDAMVVPESGLGPLDERRFPVTLTQAFELDAGGRQIHAAMADAGLAAHVGAVRRPGARRPPPAGRPRDAVLRRPPRRPGGGRRPAAVADTGPGLPRRAARRAGAQHAAAPVDLRRLLRHGAGRDGPRDEHGGPSRRTNPSIRTPRRDAGHRTRRVSRPPRRRAARHRDLRSMIGAGSPRADPSTSALLVVGRPTSTPAGRSTTSTPCAPPSPAEAAKVESRSGRRSRSPREGPGAAAHPQHGGLPDDRGRALDSDRLEFPENPGGRLDLVLDEETTRIELGVRARPSGDSPLDVDVTSPDGRLELGRTRYTRAVDRGVRRRPRAVGRRRPVPRRLVGAATPANGAGRRHRPRCGSV